MQHYRKPTLQKHHPTRIPKETRRRFHLLQFLQLHDLCQCIPGIITRRSRQQISGFIQTISTWTGRPYGHHFMSISSANKRGSELSAQSLDSSIMLHCHFHTSQLFSDRKGRMPAAQTVPALSLDLNLHLSCISVMFGSP